MAAVRMAPRHALPRAWMRTHAHPRATMRTAVACSTCAWACAHLSLVATSAATWAVCSGRRLEEPESSFELAGGGDTLASLGTGRRQVWSYRDPGLTRMPHALSRMTAPAPHMPSHLTLHCARRCRAVGEPVGALSSRCDAAALGADQARLRRARRDYFGVWFLSAAAVRLLWSASGPKGPRRRLRRRVPVNPGRRAGDAARETAARRAAVQPIPRRT